MSSSCRIKGGDWIIDLLLMRKNFKKWKTPPNHCISLLLLFYYVCRNFFCLLYFTLIFKNEFYNILSNLQSKYKTFRSLDFRFCARGFGVRGVRGVCLFFKFLCGWELRQDLSIKEGKHLSLNSIFHFYGEFATIDTYMRFLFYF